MNFVRICWRGWRVFQLELRSAKRRFNSTRPLKGGVSQRSSRFAGTGSTPNSWPSGRVCLMPNHKGPLGDWKDSRKHEAGYEMRRLPESRICFETKRKRSNRSGSCAPIHNEAHAPKHPYTHTHAHSHAYTCATPTHPICIAIQLEVLQ